MTRRGPAISSDCAACPLAIDGKPHKPVPGIGPDGRPDLIIVDMEPGNSELKAGSPFVGASGQLLNRVLRLTEVDRDRIWLTNASNCWRPETGDTDRENARICCKPRLEKELAEFPTDVPILALGASAAKSLLETTLPKDMLTMNQLIGTSQEIKLNGDSSPRTVITAIHPAAILRGGDDGGTDMLYLRMLYDVRKAKKLGQGDESIRFTEDIAVAVDPHEAHALIAGIIEEIRATPDQPFGLDWETRPAKNAPAGIQRLAAGKADDVDPLLSGIEPKKKKKGKFIPAFWTEITALGLSTSRRAIAVAWWNLREPTKKLIHELFASSIPKIIQNRVFDTCVGERHGFPIAEPIDDLMLAHHCAFPGMPHVLQAIASQFWLIRAWKSEFRNSQGTPTELLSYCLALGTPVLLSDGSIEYIENIVRRRRKCKVLSAGPRGVEPKRVVGWHRTRVVGQRWIRLRTAADPADRPKGLILTPDHEVYTQRGRVRADQATLNDSIVIPELALSAVQLDAIVGTLLGDSSLAVGPSHRHDPWASPGMMLQGGHVTRSTLPFWKAKLLPSHLIIGPEQPARRIVIRARSGLSTAAPFTTYRTRNLHQLRKIAPLVYDRNWHRRVFADTLAQLGAMGLAWWFMDDGCRQNDAKNGLDTATLTLAGFSRADAEVALEWVRAKFGTVWMGKDRVLRFSRAATEEFVGAVGHLIPPKLRYKLPRGFRDVRLFDANEYAIKPATKPSLAKVITVEDYRPATRTIQQKLRAETRYCLTVEGNHNFFTSFGLVANCSKDSLVLPRTLPKVLACVAETQTEAAYAMDLKMAALAERMHMVGMPVSRQVNQELSDKFAADIKEATETFVAGFQDPVWREKFADRVCREQAKTKRKGDRDEYEERVVTRRQELDAFGWNHTCKITGREKKFKVKLGELCKDCGAIMSFGSNAHQVAFLRAHGVNLWLTTAKGKLSTKQTILDQLVHVDGVRPLLKRREAHKLKSTFVDPIPGLLDEYDRMHVIWSVNKITGRFGSEATNVQNWSKSNPKGRPNLRAQVVAPVGRIFIGFDAAQLEARVHALLSGDAFLVKIFNDAASCPECRSKPPGRFCKLHDIHVVFCREVWKDYDSFSPEQQEKLRDEIKQPEYGCMYGASVDTMHQSILRFHPKAQKSATEYMASIIKQKLVGVNAWHDELIREVMRTGEIRSLLTRRRRVFPMGTASPNEIWNFPVQSTAADIVGEMMLRILPALPLSAYMTNQSHDSGLIEVDEAEADLAEAAVKLHGPTEYTHNGITIQFPVTVKRAKSWAQAS